MAVTLAQIKADQLQARKDKNTLVVALLTTLIGEAKSLADAVAEKEPRDANGAVIKRDPTSDELIATVRKFLKGNAEVQANVKDEVALADARKEAEILNGYLPQQLTAEQLEQIFRAEFPDGVTAKERGKAMAILKANYNGQYDGKLASDVLVRLIG
jgi:uncharacterized protein YqeY